PLIIRIQCMYTIFQIKVITHTVIRRELIGQRIQYLRPLAILTIPYGRAIARFKLMILRERQDIVYLKVPVLSRFARNILALEIRSSIRIGLIEIIRSIFRITSISDIGRDFLSLPLKLPLKIKSQVHSQILFILLRNTGRTRP